MRLFELPSFLDNIVTREAYVRWLQRKAEAHIKRDRKRRNTSGSVSQYKRAIHLSLGAFIALCTRVVTANKSQSDQKQVRSSTELKLI
jgi:hypothetical protein